MASVDSLTFDQPAYNPGDTITLDVAYTADSPSVVPQTFTATTTISDPSGNQLGTLSAPFVVNEAQAAGDVLATSDDGGRTWAETPGSDTGSSVVFTSVA